MEDGQFRGVPEDALKDKQFETPEPAGNYPFIQERVDKVKADVEEETGQTYSTFKAELFLKRNFNYVIRVNCGSTYIDLKMNRSLLQDFTETSKSAPMKF